MKKELLTRNPKILQALHLLYDFDFTSNYEVKKIDGRFTLNSIKKVLGIPELYNYNVAIIVTNVKYRERYNYVVKVTESGFCIDFSHRIYGSEYNIDHFWGKGRFEDARKSENIMSYVVYQKADLAKKASEKKPDLSGRFEYIRHIGWSNGKGTHGISQIDIIDKKHNGKQFTIHTRRPESSTNINYFIDKSGYLIEDAKEDLRRRARALRTERQKAAADAADFSEESKVHFERMEELKKRIAEKFLTVGNYDAMCNISGIVSALRWLQLSIDRFAERNESKKFSSIADINGYLNNINLEFKKIEKML